MALLISHPLFQVGPHPGVEPRHIAQAVLVLDLASDGQVLAEAFGLRFFSLAKCASPTGQQRREALPQCSSSSRRWASVPLR